MKCINASDSDAFMNEYKAAGLTDRSARILTSMDLDKQLQLHEIELKDVVDKPDVRDQAAEILEGGQAAFDMRKNKYGF